MDEMEYNTFIVGFDLTIRRLLGNYRTFPCETMATVGVTTDYATEGEQPVQVDNLKTTIQQVLDNRITAEKL